ncbi:MAG TPA: lipopolysaccharide kinase InaA family protein [Verrucomicrobiae bacterium]|nr:lipopolysaccharide kinase InaA family protein [Verrucomicrobiae bacterium]
MEAFRRIKAGNLVWLAREPLPVMEDPEASLNDAARFIKSSRVVTIARVAPNLILRRLNYGKFIHRLRDWFRPSRAVRALIASTWLEQAGIRTPRALAAADVRVLRWPRRAYFVTEEVPGARTLASIYESKRKIPREIADLIAHLHHSGLSHRDLKWTNILLDEQLTPWLVDLDGVRRLGSVPERRAIEDLWTLARCFTAYPITLKWSGARFLYRYCALRKLPFTPWAKALVRRIGRG